MLETAISDAMTKSVAAVFGDPNPAIRRPLNSRWMTELASCCPIKCATKATRAKNSNVHTKADFANCKPVELAPTMRPIDQIARPAAKAITSVRAWYQFPNKPNASQRAKIPAKASIPVVMLDRPVPRIRIPNATKLRRLNSAAALTVSAPEKKCAKTSMQGIAAATSFIDQSTVRFHRFRYGGVPESAIILFTRTSPRIANAPKESSALNFL